MMSDSWHEEPVMYNVVHIGGPYYGSVNRIPCTPEHIGTCIGMSQNRVPYATTHATISHSP
jgi:hypothetical protein